MNQYLVLSPVEAVILQCSNSVPYSWSAETNVYGNTTLAIYIQVHKHLEILLDKVENKWLRKKIKDNLNCL